MVHVRGLLGFENSPNLPRRHRYLLGDLGAGRFRLAGRFRCWEIQVLGDLDLTSRLLSVRLWGSAIPLTERITMPTYCDKCEEVIARPEELTRIDGDDLCLDCVPEPYGDFVRHVDSTTQAIYDNLPNPQYLEDMENHLRMLHRIDDSPSKRLCCLSEYADLVADCRNKFYAIMQVANKLAGKEND